MTSPEYTESLKAFDKAADAIDKTHQGTKAKFTELFVKTDIFPAETSDSISMLFDYRQEADYDLDEDISYEEAATLIDKASEIYHLTNTYFQKIMADIQQ